MTLRDAVVALVSAALSLAISLGVLAMGASKQRREVDSMEGRLVERMDGMKARADELAAELERCRSARTGAQGTAP